MTYMINAYDDNDDEIRCISHRYKVITLLVSARKINNTNTTTTIITKYKHIHEYIF